VRAAVGEELREQCALPPPHPVSIFPAVDAREAVAELAAISSQIDDAVVCGDAGGVLAATSGDGRALAEAGRALLERAAGARAVHAATAGGSLFAFGAGGRTVVVRTGPEPNAPLVLHDLERCLRGLDAA
jgi:hypothetical protein